MKKLLVLFIGLFIMVNGATFAQETDDDTDGSQEGYVTGSVSTSAYYAVPTSGIPGMIQPMQVNGGIEARAELIWGVAPVCVWFNCWMQGKAITRVISGGGVFNLCAKVDALKRNNAFVGGTGDTCGTYSVNTGIEVTTTQQGDPRGAYWLVETSHVAQGSQYFWVPKLQASVTL